MINKQKCARKPKKGASAQIRKGPGQFGSGKPDSFDGSALMRRNEPKNQPSDSKPTKVIETY